MLTSSPTPNARARLALPRFFREPFDDVRSKRPTSGVNYDTLDGFRGLAVLIVLTDHIRVIHNDNRGFVGVMMFFVLSGFLLSLTFNREGRVVVPTWRFIKEFLVRRVRRIYPLYALIIFLCFFPLAGVILPKIDFGSFARRARFFLGYMSFILSGGHFWTIAEEVYFYALLPLIFLINHHVLRERKLAIFVWLATCAYWWSTVSAGQTVLLLRVNREYPWFQWGNRPLYFDAFMLGVGTCYLAYLIARLPILAAGVVRPLTSTVGLLCTSFLIFGNRYYIGQGIAPWAPALANKLSRANNQSFVLSAVAATLIVCLLLNRDGLITKLFTNTAIRVVGVLGYSIYLVHPHVLAVFDNFGGRPQQDAVRFAVVFAITFFVSCLTYCYVEKPFLEKSATLPALWRRIRFGRERPETQPQRTAV